MKKRYQSRSISDRTNWAQKIAAAWQRNLDGIFEVGDLLVQAKAELEYGEFGKMVEHELPFGDRTAEMLMAIARDERLRNPNRGSLLPPCWRTLYEISRLTDAEFDTAIADGVISPETERGPIEAIITRRSSPKAEQAIPLEIQSLPTAPEKVALKICSSPAVSNVVAFPAATADDAAKTMIGAVLVVHRTQAMQRAVDLLLVGQCSSDRAEFAAAIGVLHCKLSPH